MDAVKIGNYISFCRKAKGYTQASLARELYITDKAVSKWERGLSVPDISLIEPLSNALGVSVAELLNGESLQESNITKDVASKLISESNRLYSILEQKKHKRICIVLLALIILIAAFIPIAYNYHSQQEKLSIASSSFHSSCDSIVEIYDGLTDENRNALTVLTETEYTNAIFCIGATDSNLFELEKFMQDYTDICDISSKLRETNKKIYEIISNSEYTDGEYHIKDISQYDKQISVFYEEYHSLLDSYEIIRQNASLDGKKAF